jgi:AAA+ ATPase superfamily predicted ATPase
MFRLEPFAFISDEVREPRNYLAIMSAIARGHHTVESIVQVSGLKRPNVGGRYLQRLQELHIVERRVPATVPRDQRTTLGRYYLEDSYLRFYFRFVHPNLDLLELGLVDELWETIEEAMPAFVEQYTFRGLCGEWMRAQARMGTLPFRPQQVGEYWAADAQIDVVAISWRERAILLGEVRWSPDPVEPPALHELVAKAPLVAPEPDWHVYYILFARAGFTDVTRQEAEAQDMLLVDLETLDQDLRQAMAPDSA